MRASSICPSACSSASVAAASTSDLSASRSRGSWTRRCPSPASPPRRSRGPAEASSSAAPCRSSTCTIQRGTRSHRKRRSTWRGGARRRRSRAIRASPTRRRGFADRRLATHYATSHGFAGRYETSSFSLSVSPWPPERRDAARLLVSRDAQGRAAGGAGGDRAHRGAAGVAPAGSPTGEDGGGAGHLRPGHAASLVRHIAGAASGPALYRRASFLVGRLGERIAAPAVTVVDNGTLPGALGSRPFDGEGLAGQDGPSSWTGCGSARTCSTPTAARSSGCVHASRRAGRERGERVDDQPLSRGGGVGPAELIKSVKNGLFVTELIGFGSTA